MPRRSGRNGLGRRCAGAAHRHRTPPERPRRPADTGRVGRERGPPGETGRTPPARVKSTRQRHPFGCYSRRADTGTPRAPRVSTPVTPSASSADEVERWSATPMPHRRGGRAGPAAGQRARRHRPRPRVDPAAPAEPWPRRTASMAAHHLDRPPRPRGRSRSPRPPPTGSALPERRAFPDATRRPARRTRRTAHRARDRPRAATPAAPLRGTTSGPRTAGRGLPPPGSPAPRTSSSQARGGGEGRCGTADEGSESFLAAPRHTTTVSGHAIRRTGDKRTRPGR